MTREQALKKIAELRSEGAGCLGQAITLSYQLASLVFMAKSDSAAAVAQCIQAYTAVADSCRQEAERLREEWIP